MRKSRYFLLILVFFTSFVMNPVYVTNSSNIKLDGSISEKQIVEIEINNLQRKINNEYQAFYRNLYNQDLKLSKWDRERNIDFIFSIKYHAIESKSLPSISLSQAILETGFGKSNELEYNIFGIKGKGVRTTTKEYYNGKFVSINDEFKKIGDLTEAFNCHYKIIKRYCPQNRDYKDWAYKIKNNGYATDPRYAHKLIFLIEKYDLDRLDKIQQMNDEMEKLITCVYDGV